jgi:hypothetical protein
MKLETGCYVDSHHGIFGVQRLCEIAQEFGWDGRVPTDDEARESEDYYEYGDEALHWLNENIAEEDHLFDWYEGGVYYWTLDEWANEWL